MKETTGNSEAGSTKVRRRKKRRLWVWLLLVVILLAAAAGVYLAIQDLRAVAMGAISPAPDTVLNSPSQTISCELSRYVPGRGVVTVSVDGQPAPAAAVRSAPGAVQAQLSLADGQHTVSVAYDSSNLFSRHLERTWSFSVDTVAPAVTIASPASFPLFGEDDGDIALRTSEAAVVSLTLDGVDVPVDSGGGADTLIMASLTPEEGEHTVAVAATDDAGNVTRQSWDIRVDLQAPELTTEGLPDAEVWKKQTSAAVTVTAADRFAEQVEMTGTLDGAPLDLKQAGGDARHRLFTFDTGTLAEGQHLVRISARDVAGHESVIEYSWLMDTSETFGARPLQAGAEGSDVKQLQRILKIKGVYDGDPTGTLDESTTAAVAAFNEQHGLSSLLVTEETLKFLLGRLQIDLSERKLSLFDGDDKLVKTYQVAVGMAAYPTPTGAFRVISKEKNPTWDPPNSAWAKGMGPVPPGPDNPLGTRWMGLNSPGIGIHGTPNPGSIGSAASHGCIRMRIPEAEDLFDRIFVGTPVEIVA